jgi:ABC-type cobalamin/Fe3+-siderophores transport system ATPase subunit
MSAHASVERATVAYGSRIVFAGVTLALEPGKFTAVIGPNGSGKSSLLRVLAGIQRPAAGIAARADGVALIASSSNPPSDVTPAELADYGLALRRPWWRLRPDAADAAAVAGALARTGLTQRADDAVSELSDGEVQRAWIAAALAAGCRTLLIDEPTSHLDLRYQVEVLQTLRALTAQGAAVAAAIHDLTLAARYADTVALLAAGRLIAGPPAEVLRPQAIADAFGIDVTVFDHPTEGYLICMPR